MRRIALLGFGLALAASPAFAADLPVKAAPYMTAAPAMSWTGFYAGLNAGGVWGSDSGARASGFIGGGQIGYNWQAGQIVFGLEADLQGTSAKASTTVIVGAAGISETARLNYLGTVRGRLGYAIGDWMPYITGGWAYGGIKHDGNGVGAIVGSYSATNNLSGWTVGGGVEWMFLPKWSAKLEYLHAELPSHSNTYGTTVPAVTVSYGKVQGDLVRVGLNYHF